MNTTQNSAAAVPHELKKSFSPPLLRHEARIALVTAGSFDLVIPGTR